MCIMTNAGAIGRRHSSFGEYVPQQTLFDGWDISDLVISVHLNTNKPGGRIHVEFRDELGKCAGARSITWTKDRDCTCLGQVLNDVASAWLWAPQLEALDQLRVAVPKHMPEVPSGTE